MLSRGECIAADTTSATAIDRHVLRKLVVYELACFVSTPTAMIERARITELGRSVVQQLDRP
jgi:hypothetical protein